MHGRKRNMLLFWLPAVLMMLCCCPAFAALEDEADRNYIEVEKHITGIGLSQIPEAFSVMVKNKADNKTYTLTPGMAEEVTETADGVTLHWHVLDLSAGTYNISESGQDALEGYTVSTSGNFGDVTLEALEMTIGTLETSSGASCNLTENVLFTAKLTGSVGKGAVVVSLKRKNATERMAIEENLRRQHGLKTNETVYFFSVEEHGTDDQSDAKFTIGGKTVTYNYTTGIVRIDSSSMWNKAYTVELTYDETGASHADIQITNAYTPHQLMVTKTVDGNIGSRFRSFSYDLMIPEMAGKTIEATLAGAPHQLILDGRGYATFSLSHGQALVLNGVHGTYSLQETGGHDYDTAVSINGGGETTGSMATGTLPAGLTTVAFRNTLEAALPTGVTDSTACAFAGLVLALALMMIQKMGGGCARHE